jgi:hypothetical protein
MLQFSKQDGYEATFSCHGERDLPHFPEQGIGIPYINGHPDAEHSLIGVTCLIYLLWMQVDMTELQNAQ